MNRHWVTISWGHVLPVFCLLSDYRITTWSVRLTGYSHTHTVRMRVRLCQTRQTQSRTITASQTPMPTPIPRCLQIRTCPAPVSETDLGVSAYRILSSTNSGQQHILRITLSAYIAGLIFNCWCFFFFQRLRTVCLHQSYGSIHNVWSLCVSYQKRGQVCRL